MLRPGFIVLALLGLPGPAQADQQCFPNNPQIPAAGQTCHEVGSRAGGESIFQMARDKKVGSLIADGRCAEAMDVALRAGDFRLADRVKTYCPAPKP